MALLILQVKWLGVVCWCCFVLFTCLASVVVHVSSPNDRGEKFENTSYNVK